MGGQLATTMSIVICAGVTPVLLVHQTSSTPTLQVSIGSAILCGGLLRSGCFYRRLRDPRSAAHQTIDNAQATPVSPQGAHLIHPEYTPQRRIESLEQLFSICASSNSRFLQKVSLQHHSQANSKLFTCNFNSF